MTLALQRPNRPLIWSPAVDAVCAAVPREAGAYLVGGAVRDAYLHRPIRDIDLATPGDGRPVEIGVTDSASDEAAAESLRDYQQTLPRLVDTIRIHNRRNRELIHAALADTEGALQLIRSMVSPAANYQKTGRFNANAVQGTFIHREG